MFNNKILTFLAFTLLFLSLSKVTLAGILNGDFVRHIDSGTITQITQDELGRDLVTLEEIGEYQVLVLGYVLDTFTLESTGTYHISAISYAGPYSVARVEEPQLDENNNVLVGVVVTRNSDGATYQIQFSTNTQQYTVDIDIVGTYSIQVLGHILYEFSADVAGTYMITVNGLGLDATYTVTIMSEVNPGSGLDEAIEELLQNEVYPYQENNGGILQLEKINLNQLSQNYARRTNSGNSSVYFYVPTAQPNVVESSFTRARRSLWSGRNGVSKITVLAMDSENIQHAVVLRLQKKFRGRWLRMNDGVQRGHGQVKITFSPDDNPNLPIGDYTTEFLVIGAGWHDKDYRAGIEADLNFRNNGVNDCL